MHKPINTVTLTGRSREECALAMTLEYLRNDALAKGVPADQLKLLELTAEGKQAVAYLHAAGFEFNPGEREEIAGPILFNLFIRTLPQTVAVVVVTPNQESESEQEQVVH